jgi:hypothetical protein
MRAPIRIASPAIVLGLALAACGPGAPQGVDKGSLDDAVSHAIGDPATCVLIAEQPSGKVVYRYNNNVACSRVLPACDSAGKRTVADLLKAALKDGQAHLLSCTWPNDASKGISWAAGPIPGKKLTYAALMEGARAMPGRMMAERLDAAFKSVGLEPH